MSAKPINVSLAVMFVASGGNTRDSLYFYSFTPATINVTEPDTEVIFTLSPDTAARFQIADLYASDNSGNLSGIKRSTDRRSLSVVNSNKVQQLVFVSLLVMDGDIRINCDPQMTNTPTGSGG
jgi:hypothetical protein